MAAGYSGTPLAKKLGIKTGFTISVINTPQPYAAFFNELPDELVFTGDAAVKKDLIHLFVTDKRQLTESLIPLRDQIKPNGAIWVSWYKRASGIVTDVTEDDIRATALVSGLVDVKVCAVDEQWSGLKLVIRLTDR